MRMTVETGGTEEFFHRGICVELLWITYSRVNRGIGHFRPYELNAGQSHNHDNCCYSPNLLHTGSFPVP